MKIRIILTWIIAFTLLILALLGMILLFSLAWQNHTETTTGKVANKWIKTDCPKNAGCIQSYIIEISNDQYRTLSKETYDDIAIGEVLRIETRGFRFCMPFSDCHLVLPEITWYEHVEE